jgi:hypothetical protein
LSPPLVIAQRDWTAREAIVVDRLRNGSNGTLTLVLDVEAGDPGDGFRATLTVAGRPSGSPVEVGDRLAVEVCPSRRQVRPTPSGSPLNRFLASFPVCPLVLG